MQIQQGIVSFLFVVSLLHGCQSLPYSSRGRSQSPTKFGCNGDQTGGISLTGGEITTPIDTSSRKKTGIKTYGEDNFGDIMLRDNIGCETDVSISSEFTNIERMILTANGNLQRIMSAYYGSPIKVEVIKSEPISRSTTKEGVMVTYDREVDLLVNGRKFCNAITKVRYQTHYYIHAYLLTYHFTSHRVVFLDSNI